MIKNFLATFAAALVAMGIFLIGFGTHLQNQNFGNVITQGIVPQFSSASVVPVGPQQVKTLASRAANCSSRTISTASTTLMLSFGSITPSMFVGHYQAASTTASYDNANFGCGAITAYSTASSTVTVTTFTQ